MAHRKSRHAGLALCVTLLLASSCIPASSQDGHPQIEKLRRANEIELIKARGPIVKKYVAKLQALQDDLTRAGRIEEAVLVRTERLALEKELAVLRESAAKAKAELGQGSGPGTTPRTEPSAELRGGEILLEPEDAELKGGLTISEGAITNWKSLSNEASWTVENVAPGIYDIYLQYDYYRGSGGLIEISHYADSAPVKIVPRYKFGPEGQNAGFVTVNNRINFKIRQKTRTRSAMWILRGVRLVQRK